MYDVVVLLNLSSLDRSVIEKIISSGLGFTIIDSKESKDCKKRKLLTQVSVCGARASYLALALLQTE